MRWREDESRRSVQSNYCHVYDDDGYNVVSTAVRSKIPPRELGDDETALYPLDEDAYDAWAEHRGLIMSQTG